MKQSDAYELLIKEYIDQCKCLGCDSCFAEFYCMSIGQRYGPDYDCVKTIKEYFKKL